MPAIRAGRQADAVVDHLEAAVARRDRDLLGAVGMAVEAGLADQHLGPPAEAPGELLDPRPHLGERALVAASRARPPTPVGAR